MGRVSSKTYRDEGLVHYSSSVGGSRRVVLVVEGPRCLSEALKNSGGLPVAG